eukprot:gene5089-34887_t
MRFSLNNYPAAERVVPKPQSTTTQLPMRVGARRQSKPTMLASSSTASDTKLGQQWSEAGTSGSSSSTYKVLDNASGDFVETLNIKVPSKPKLALSWAGAGIFFFWQLGALFRNLQEVVK